MECKNSKYRIFFIVIILTIVLSAACAGKRDALKPAGTEGDELFRTGNEYYELGKWSKAIKILNEFTLSYPYHANVAEGTYILAESYFNKEDYELAIVEYRRIIRRFSESEFAEKAELMLAESFLESAPNIALEQDVVERALGLYRDFITYRPKSEFIGEAREGVERCRDRLAHKEYYVINLYYKLHKADAAVLYADLLVEEYNGTTWVPKAMLIKGKALYEQLDQSASAKKIFAKIIEDYPDSEEADEAEEYLLKIEG